MASRPSIVVELGGMRWASGRYVPATPAAFPALAAVAKAESVARMAARSAAASGLSAGAEGSLSRAAGRQAPARSAASARGKSIVRARDMAPPAVEGGGRPGGSAEDSALTLLHAAKLPGLRDHAAEEEDDGGVVDPQHEQHRGPDVGVAARALDRR